MSLQNTVDLRLSNPGPGAAQDGGNARVSKSYSWQGADDSVLLGRFVARGATCTEAVAVSAGTTTLSKVVGIVENPKLQMNAIGGSSPTFAQGDSLSVYTQGAIYALCDNTAFGPDSNIYLITSDAGTPEHVGRLTTNVAAGDSRLLVGGPLFATGTNGVPMVRALQDRASGSDGSVLVQISNL